MTVLGDAVVAVVKKLPKSAAFLSLPLLLLAAGCFPEPVPPGDVRAERAARTLQALNNLPPVPDPLTPECAVAYAMQNNLNVKAAAIDLAYREEEVRGSWLKMLPRLQAQAEIDARNHPNASSSQDATTGLTSLQSSYSTDTVVRPTSISLVWNLLDFGAGYIRAMQSGQSVLQSREQLRRLRQQTALETLTAYWRAEAAEENAREAGELISVLEKHVESIRESRARNVLSAADAARQELAIMGGIVEAEHWLKVRDASRKELARSMGCLDGEFAIPYGSMPRVGIDPETEDLAGLQLKALHLRPELYQADSQERVSLDDAKLALLQMAPNANLSLALNHNDDSHLAWSDWATAGIRVTWNLLSIPARLSEKRSAELRAAAARERGEAIAAGIIAQVGIAMSDWRHTSTQMTAIAKRTETRNQLVTALSIAETGGQARPGEVLQERVRLLTERSALRMREADAKIALARVANAVGLDIDDNGRFVK